MCSSDLEEIVKKILIVDMFINRDMTTKKTNPEKVGLLPKDKNREVLHIDDNKEICGKVDELGDRFSGLYFNPINRRIEDDEEKIQKFRSLENLLLTSEYKDGCNIEEELNEIISQQHEEVGRSVA